MSTRVVSGLAPAGRPHPATKWSLLMALLVVVVLGIPKFAAAGAPAVQAPTGPGEQYRSGTYYFTGTYTFRTTAYCSDGTVVTDSHSYGFTGTFVFYGGADGSLYVSIDGGSLALLDSCGNPTYTGSAAASFTVQMGSPPSPTPTPTPNPTPNPTPTPTPHTTHTPSPTPRSTGSGGGPGATSNSASTGGNSSPSPTPSPPPGQAATPTPAFAPTPSASPHRHTVDMITAGGKSSPPGQGPGGRALDLTKSLMAAAGIALLAFLMLLRYSRLGAFFAAWWRRRWLRLEPYAFRARTYFRNYFHVKGHDEPKRRGLSEHRHSGKMLAHHHTSYAALVFLLLIAALMAIGVAITSQADQSNQVQLSLTVPGAPPSQAATIASPADGTVTSTPTVTIQGTCPSNVFVEIWRNGTFAGSSVCSTNFYSILVTLAPGGNTLVARVVDALSQYGPDSQAILVTYNQPSPPPSPTPTPTPSPAATPSPSSSPKTPAGASPAPKPATSSVPSTPLITATVHNQNADPGQPVTWQVRIAGGVAPYNVTWEWGDGSSHAAKQSGAGSTSATHTYTKSGDYSVIVRVTDHDGQQADLQLVTVINGNPAAAAPTGPTGGPNEALFALWPTLIATGLIVFSFWLGERHRRATEAPVLAAAA